MTLQCVRSGTSEFALTLPTSHTRENTRARQRLVGHCRASSCPSWDRTRTLLIQSQACCQLHQGAMEPKVSERAIAMSRAAQPKVSERAIAMLRAAQLLCFSPGNWLIPGTFEISRRVGQQQP